MALLLSLGASAQGLNARFLTYIERYKEVAMEHCRTHGVPASITLAQGLLESSAGSSYLATQGNNHFGIKCFSWKGESVQYNDTLAHDCYRKYGSPEDSYLDHARFLCGKRYQPLHELDTTDYRGWAEGLRTCGYAEDPAYPQKLTGIIERYSLNLYDSLALVPPVKVATHHDKKHDRKRDRHQQQQVPAPPKKQHKEQAQVPPPPSRQDRERDKTPVAVDKPTRTKPEAKPKTEPNVEPKVEYKTKAKPERRPRNQRTTASGTPLTGNADNDD